MREMKSVTQVQILDEAVYVSLRANDFEKYINPLVSTPVMSKL